MSTEHEQSQETCLELSCSRHQLKTASINHGPRGTIFNCSCGPLAEDELEQLGRAARDGTRVRLEFPDSEVILSHVSFVQEQPGWVQLSGRVVAVPMRSAWRTTQRPQA